MQSSIGTKTTYQIDDDQSASEAVLDAIAADAGVDVLDLAVPLYDVVDPDALDAFYRTASGDGASGATVSFSYYGYDVEVSGDGELVLAE